MAFASYQTNCAGAVLRLLGSTEQDAWIQIEDADGNTTDIARADAEAVARAMLRMATEPLTELTGHDA
jgi:hypothetical protein